MRDDGAPQGNEAGWFFDAVEPGEHQVFIGTVRPDADAGILRQVVGDRSEHLVEPFGQPADLLGRSELKQQETLRPESEFLLRCYSDPM